MYRPQGVPEVHAQHDDHCEENSLILSSTETKDQMHYVTWMRAFHPDVIFTISPAAFKFAGTPLQRQIQGKRMKAMGYQVGTPDIMVFYPIGLYHGLFIELKYGKGKLSDEQRELLLRLSTLGYSCWTCLGYKEAVEVTTRYLKGDIRS